MKNFIVGNYRILKRYLEIKRIILDDFLQNVIPLTLKYIWKAVIMLTIYELYKIYI